MDISASLEPQTNPKILHVTGGLSFGGSDLVALNVAEALINKCESDFLLFQPGEPSLEERVFNLGGQVHRMASPRHSGPLKFFRDLRSLLLAHKYDAIHSHVNLGSGVIMKVARDVGIPVRITHAHSSEFPTRGTFHSSYQKIARHLIIRNSTSLVACTDQAGKALFGGGWDGQVGTVIPNGVRVEDFLSEYPHRSRMRSMLGISDEIKAVGMIARMVSEKNHRFIFEAIALDKKRGGTTVLFLAGEGPLKPELKELASKLEISERIKFIGLRSDIPRLMVAFDLLVLPSHFEGLGVVLIEAQAAGIPALASIHVPRQADLGLGLLTFLPLDVSTWQENFYREVPKPALEVIKAKFIESGYSLAMSSEKFLSLYKTQ